MAAIPELVCALTSPFCWSCTIFSFIAFFRTYQPNVDNTCALLRVLLERETEQPAEHCNDNNELEQMNSTRVHVRFLSSEVALVILPLCFPASCPGSLVSANKSHLSDETEQQAISRCRLLSTLSRDLIKNRAFPRRNEISLFLCTS